MAKGDQVTQYTNMMRAARHGGDYAEIFQGKTLAFKFSKILSDVSDLQEAGAEVCDSVPPVLDAFEDNAVVRVIIEIGRIIKAGGKLMLGLLRKAFARLVKVFDALRDALDAVFAPLEMVVEAAINFLIDVLPNAFIEFVQGLVAAILPFVGQIKACATMLSSVKEVVAGAVERWHLGDAGLAIDESNRFSTAARTAAMSIVDADLRRAGGNALLDAANAGASVSGLVFTGNVAGVVVGLATAIAKLCLKIADIVGDLREMRRGNALLAKMLLDPRRDVNPATLFKTAPILGCIYLAQASQSSLIANTGFLDSVKVKLALTEFGWRAEYEAKARQFSPLRLKAMQMTLASRLELTAEARMGIQFDVSATELVRDQISSMISDRIVDAGGNALGDRFLPAEA